MKIKRILCLALALALLLSLAGCGRAAQSETAADGGAGSKATATAPASAGQENTDTEQGAAAATSGGIKTVEEMIAEKNQLEAEVASDGVAYARKKNVHSYLFMGIDEAGYAPTTATEFRNSGQCDTILPYVVDDDAKKYTILQINRDTMVTVDILNYYGDIISQTTQQLEFAHSYGNGFKASGENVARAVSRLLGGVEIDGWIALQFGAIPPVNDTLGGVKVKIEDDFSNDDPTLIQGETVELVGEHAMKYLRGRMKVGDGTNTSRMHRQMIYLAAFTKRLREELKAGNSNIINQLYNAASPYMVSDMSMGSITNVAVRCAGYSQGSTKTLSGTNQVVTYKNGVTMDEYTVDPASLDAAVLDLYYTAVD